MQKRQINYEGNTVEVIMLEDNTFQMKIETETLRFSLVPITKVLITGLTLSTTGKLKRRYNLVNIYYYL